MNISNILYLSFLVVGFLKLVRNVNNKPFVVKKTTTKTVPQSDPKKWPQKVIQKSYPKK